MNIEEMTLEEKLEYYQRQTHQLKKRRDDAIDKIEFFKDNISELKDCQEKTVFNDKDLSRKWSN